jgi:hypothetical protein
MIIDKIIILSLFLYFVQKFPKLADKNEETKFNFYRSLMCLYFSLYSLENTINTVLDLNEIDMVNDTKFKFLDISRWFVAYLTVDMGKMISMKSTRWDLYIHHIWCLITYGLGFYYNKIGFLHNLVLINESISIVSGIDSLFMEENNMEDSRKCKIYRKKIINYLRLPIWIIFIIISYMNRNKVEPIMFYNGIITASLMICLDQYWAYKCDKVINKNNILN